MSSLGFTEIFEARALDFKEVFLLDKKQMIKKAIKDRLFYVLCGATFGCFALGYLIEKEYLRAIANFIMFASYIPEVVSAYEKQKNNESKMVTFRVISVAGMTTAWIVMLISFFH